MTTFQIDLLQPGGFARDWRDWFLGSKGGKRLLIAYSGCALAILLVLLLALPKKFSVQEERRTIKTLGQEISQRQKELANQRALYQGILDLSKYEIVWSDVFKALSQHMPPNLWLQSVEFTEGTATKHLLRLVLGSALTPGGETLITLDKFLSDLTRDPRFKKFSLQDWEANLSKGGGNKGENVLVTVTFNVGL